MSEEPADTAGSFLRIANSRPPASDKGMEDGGRFEPVKNTIKVFRE
ncbi:hypothetical protein [Ruegeria atlantica]|nr:hypothetical protein [Ruegeria atlantica]